MFSIFPSLSALNDYFTDALRSPATYFCQQLQKYAKKPQATPNTIAPSTTTCPRRKNDPKGIGPA